MVNISTFDLRVVKTSSKRYDFENKYISGPDDAYNILNRVLEIDARTEEIFVIATLNNKNAITGIFEVSKGSINSSIVHPREVFKRALSINAASIVLCHNHPSGDPSPSKEDIAITQRLKEAGTILGIQVLDHVIIGNEKYISLKDKGVV